MQDRPETTDILDYSKVGFDAFLSRSIDNEYTPSGATLNFLPVPSAGQQLNYDQMQVGGSLGDRLKLGRVQINGTDGQITVSDGENVRVVIGFQQDGF